MKQAIKGQPNEVTCANLMEHLVFYIRRGDAETAATLARAIASVTLTGRFPRAK